MKIHEVLNVPNGSRTRVTAVKGQCPRPLDDGDLNLKIQTTICTRRVRWGPIKCSCQWLVVRGQHKNTTSLVTDD